MKKNIFKVLLSFLILTIPTLYFSNNVSANNHFILVNKSIINLSPQHLPDSSYLNSEEIKCYLLSCIMKADFLEKSNIQEMAAKLHHAGFECLNAKYHDGSEKVILRIWVPKDTTTGEAIHCGTLYSIPMSYEI